MTPPHQRNAKTPAGLRRVRVVVAAADPALRRAVRDARAGSPSIVVAADARDEVETLELTRWYRPEIVLVDLALPPRGAAVSKILAVATCAVVVLAPDGDDGPAGLGSRAHPDPHGLRPVRSALTDREWEVLDLIGAGASTREIAEALLVTRDTVYGHVKRILRKLGVRTRQEAVTAGRALRTPIGA